MSNLAGPEQPTVPKGRFPWGKIALVLGLIGGVVFLWATGLLRYLRWEYIRANVTEWQDLAQRHGFLAVLVFFAVYVGVTALSLPAAFFLSLLAGALFGWWIGVSVVTLAATCGACLAFLSSRYLFRDWVRQRFGFRLAAIDRGVQRDGAYFLFTLRLIPAVPFFLINLGMGLTPMPLRTYALVSFVGMLPATMVIVNAGKQLATIEQPRDVLSPAVLGSLALLGLMPLAIRLALRMMWKRTAPQPSPGAEKVAAETSSLDAVARQNRDV